MLFVVVIYCLLCVVYCRLLLCVVGGDCVLLFLRCFLLFVGCCGVCVDGSVLMCVL